MPIAHFVSLEGVCVTGNLCRLGLLATLWCGTLIAVVRMESIVYVALEPARTVKPWAGTNEDSSAKPIWAVVAIRGAAIGRAVVVTIGTVRGRSDFDADLSSRFGRGNREADGSNGS